MTLRWPRVIPLESLVPNRVGFIFSGTPRKRLASIALLCIAAWFVAGSVAAANLVPERVTFDSLDIDPATGAPVPTRRPTRTCA